MIKTITFFSNYYNHHQKALCDELYKILGDGFVFVATMPMEAFRAGMGWGEEEPSYVLHSYVSDENENKAYELALSSDLVIMGTAPEDFIRERLIQNKLIFRYSERPLKEGFIKFFIPRLTKKYLNMHVKNRNKNIYILAASAFTRSDYKKMFNSYPDKCYKFGYFPVHLEYDLEKLLKEKKEKSGDKVSILWMGRMIKLKHPELVIKALKVLKEEGLKFSLHMVGEGDMRPKLEKMVNDFHMQEDVTFENFLSPLEARKRMSEHEIYVMTSDKLEGWGSVIYEGLNAACACVVSHICGATPWLVCDGGKASLEISDGNVKTGLLFKSESVKSLTDKLRILIKDESLRKELATNAYNQMHERWNPEVAAGNIIKLAEGLILNNADGNKISTVKKGFEIENGPCSEAPYLQNNWYKE